MSTELAIRTAELRIRKSEINHQQRMEMLDLLKEISLTLLRNPVFDYIAGLIIIEWLSTHSVNIQDENGSWRSKRIIPGPLAFAAEATLAAGLATNALGGGVGVGAALEGGGAGLAAILSVLKGMAVAAPK